MKQLKFRCCNGEQMVSPDYITREGIAWWKEDSIPTSNSHIMQFTGLLDKHNKEIYEADILEGFDYPVGFMEGAFGCRILYDQIFLTLHNCPQKELLVLGNVYENPELLIK